MRTRLLYRDGKSGSRNRSKTRRRNRGLGRSRSRSWGRGLDTEHQQTQIRWSYWGILGEGGSQPAVLRAPTPLCPLPCRKWLYLMPASNTLPPGVPGNAARIADFREMTPQREGG